MVQKDIQITQSTKIHNVERISGQDIGVIKINQTISHQDIGLAKIYGDKMVLQIIALGVGFGVAYKTLEHLEKKTKTPITKSIKAPIRMPAYPKNYNQRIRKIL